jgi:hypothetical protein
METLFLFAGALLFDEKIHQGAAQDFSQTM